MNVACTMLLLPRISTVMVLVLYEGEEPEIIRFHCNINAYHVTSPNLNRWIMWLYVSKCKALQKSMKIQPGLRFVRWN